MFAHEVTEARRKPAAAPFAASQSWRPVPAASGRSIGNQARLHHLAAQAEVRPTALPATNCVTNIVALGDSSMPVLRRTPAPPVSQSAPAELSATPTIWPANDEIPAYSTTPDIILHCRDLANTLSVPGTIEHAYLAWLAAKQYRKYDPKDTRFFPAAGNPSPALRDAEHYLFSYYITFQSYGLGVMFMPLFSAGWGPFKILLWEFGNHAVTRPTILESIWGIRGALDAILDVIPDEGTRILHAVGLTITIADSNYIHETFRNPYDYWLLQVQWPSVLYSPSVSPPAIPAP
jgi:hypothetical protein